MRETAVWFGTIGKEYSQHVHGLAEDPPGEPGSYIFARRESSGRTPLCVGQTKDLYTRLGKGHHKRGCATLYRAARPNSGWRPTTRADRGAGPW